MRRAVSTLEGRCSVIVPTPGFYQATFLEVLMRRAADSEQVACGQPEVVDRFDSVSFVGKSHRRVCTLLTAS